MQAIQSKHFLVYLLGLLAHVHRKAGHHAEAMAAVDDGLALAESSGERVYSAELCRLRGELLAAPAHADRREAEAAFRAAIEIARQQGATALERKGEASLARCRA